MIKQVLFRIYTNNIDESIAFYELLTGEKCANRFEYHQVNLELARVQNFLIIAGSDQALIPFRQTSATFLVDSLTNYRQLLLENKAEIIREIQVVPTGWNMTVKHADRLIVEYVEHKTRASDQGKFDYNPPFSIGRRNGNQPFSSNCF